MLGVVVHVEVHVLVSRLLYHYAHLPQGLGREPHHAVYVLVLLVGEVLGCILPLPAHGACKVVAAVPDALQFRADAHHVLYLHLRLHAQPALADLRKVVGNLHFHAVGNALVLFYARIEFVEVLPLLSGEQFLRHAEHAHASVHEDVDFLLRLQYRQLCRRQESASDEGQPHVLVVGHALTLRHEHAYQFLHGLDEPYQYHHLKYSLYT